MWNDESRAKLATLRLVNKSFCYSASVRLFRHLDATFGLNTNIPPLMCLHQISQSPNAMHVRQIDLGYLPEIRTSTAEMKVFSNLRAISFGGPPASLPEEHRKIHMNTVITALLYAPLSSLVELQLFFPIANDFGKLFPAETSSLRTPIESILRRLRYLGLYVRDYTGTQDQRYDKQSVLPEHAALPNNAHSAHLFKIVKLATDLESLAIASSDYLTFDDPELLSQNRLRCLKLKSLSISSDGLLALVFQSRETMRYISLFQVQLSSGTWQHVLSELYHLPHLLQFSIKSCGYSFTGTSSHLASEIPPIDFPEAIETHNSLDKSALKTLRYQVNLNKIAAGFSTFFDY
ncbi:hypothetical protein N7507_006635 [Penicillium longicatenatum]|nr:hypothetical protein N7507_006635 [Penicillium longicatenatum]